MSDDRNVALVTGGTHGRGIRLGKPDDIAAMMYYLISPQAGFIT